MASLSKSWLLLAKLQDFPEMELVNPGPAIATAAALLRPDVLAVVSLDVLIWAGTGRGLAPIPAAWLGSRPEQVRGAVRGGLQ